MHDEASLWRSLLALRRPDGAHARPAPARDAPAAQAALIDLYLPLAEARGPYAVAHLGQSLDGRIATAAGASRWVTGEEDLLHTHRMRALADAILVGSGTLRHDDPQLTVRRCAGDHPVRVVIDCERRLGPEYRVFQDGAAPTLLLAAADRARPGERLGQAEIVPVPRGEPVHRRRRRHHLALSRRRRARPAAAHRRAGHPRLRAPEPVAAGDRRAAPGLAAAPAPLQSRRGRALRMHLP